MDFIGCYDLLNNTLELMSRKDRKRQDVFAQMMRDPEEAMELKD